LFDTLQVTSGTVIPVITYTGTDNKNQWQKVKLANTKNVNNNNKLPTYT